MLFQYRPKKSHIGGALIINVIIIIIIEGEATLLTEIKAQVVNSSSKHMCSSLNTEDTKTIQSEQVQMEAK